MLKSTLSFLAVAILIAGCSTRVSYRNAYKFDRYVRAAPSIDSVYNEELVAVADHPELTSSLDVSPGMVTNQHSTMRPVPVSKSRGLSNSTIRLTSVDTVVNSNQDAQNQPLEGREAAAVAGLIFTVGGYLLAFVPFLEIIAAIAIFIGFLLCLRGLKSKKRTAAKIGLLIQAAFVVFSIAALFYFVFVVGF